MLKRAPSLVLRAGLTFMSIYTIVFVAVLAVSALSRSTDPGGSHQGPQIALRYAAAEMRATGSFGPPADGRFRRLAAKNPSMWLVGRSGDRSFSLGPVPESAAALVGRYHGVLDTVRFAVPTAKPPLNVAAIRRYDLGTGTVVLAAGGVDPATLTIWDTLRVIGSGEALVVLLVIAALGFLAMLVALPLFARAIRPIAAEAEALDPRDADRRLDEDAAPREMLPLVRAFNAALDRLAWELRRRKRFVADVAHELRTPLAVVSLKVEALEDEAARADLRGGVGRLSHLVGQMLDLERLSLAGGQRAPFDLSDATRDMVADLAPMAIKAGHDLSLDVPDRPVTVVGDRHAVERAITNLVGNAIAHGGGNIQLFVGADRTVDVQDDGPGVSAALRPRLFEPFCRESSSEGSGLGLHLTREIMRAHGGDVRFLPTERGARFRLEFPPPDPS